MVISLPIVWCVLVAGGDFVLILMPCNSSVALYENRDVPLAVQPFQSEPAGEATGTVKWDWVTFYTFNEMARILFYDIFNPEIINY